MIAALFVEPCRPWCDSGWICSQLPGHSGYHDCRCPECWHDSAEGHAVGCVVEHPTPEAPHG